MLARLLGDMTLSTSLGGFGGRLLGTAPREGLLNSCTRFTEGVCIVSALPSVRGCEAEAFVGVVCWPSLNLTGTSRTRLASLSNSSVVTGKCGACRGVLDPSRELSDESTEDCGVSVMGFDEISLTRLDGVFASVFVGVLVGVLTVLVLSLNGDVIPLNGLFPSRDVFTGVLDDRLGGTGISTSSTKLVPRRLAPRSIFTFGASSIRLSVTVEESLI